MANTFTGPMLDVTSTDLTTLLTVPTADPGATPPVPPTTVIIDSIIVCSDSGSATFKQFHQKSIAAGATVDLLENSKLVLQASDVLKIQANEANQIHITVASMQIEKGKL